MQRSIQNKSRTHIRIDGPRLFRQYLTDNEKEAALPEAHTPHGFR
jgi:hypothetical protein